MSDLSYPALAQMQAAPLFDHLGMRFTDAGDGWAEITLVATDRVMNLYGIVHGGAWLFLADSAMGGALGTVAPEGDRILTGQLDFRWLRPLEGDTIVARGQVLRRGRTLNHATVTFRDSAGREIGFGSGTYVIQAPTA